MEDKPDDPQLATFIRLVNGGLPGADLWLLLCDALILGTAISAAAVLEIALPVRANAAALLAAAWATTDPDKYLFLLSATVYPLAPSEPAALRLPCVSVKLGQVVAWGEVEAGTDTL